MAEADFRNTRSQCCGAKGRRKYRLERDDIARVDKELDLSLDIFCGRVYARLGVSTRIGALLRWGGS